VRRKISVGYSFFILASLKYKLTNRTNVLIIKIEQMFAL